MTSSNTSEPIERVIALRLRDWILSTDRATKDMLIEDGLERTLRDMGVGTAFFDLETALKLLERHAGNDHVHGGCDELTEETEVFVEMARAALAKVRGGG